MADRKPPKLEADERETLLALLQYQRESFVRKVEGLTDEQAAASPVASGTSLLSLANHLADAEALWFQRRFAGRTEVADADHAPTAAGALARYQRGWATSDEVIAGADLGDPCPGFDGEPIVNLRWIVAHLLEETARHAGHADILRELLDGATGR